MKTEFYLELRKQAEERFPSDEKARDGYINGFIAKIANILEKTHPQGSLVDSFLNRGMAQAAGKALVGGTVAAGFAGLMGVVNTVRSHALYNKYLEALNEASKTNAVLRAADKKKLMNFGNTIFKFAPHVATDSNVLTNILSNAIHGDALDTMTIRMLTELEGRYQDTKGQGTFNPKSWI
jgi:hypothetical protein